MPDPFSRLPDPRPASINLSELSSSRLSGRPIIQSPGFFRNTPETDALKKFTTPYKGSRVPMVDFPDYPSVVKPTFRQPLVIGQPDEAKQVEELLDMYPNLRQTVKDVRFGPTEGASSELAKSGFKPEEYSDTNLLGTTNTRTGEISLRPNNWMDKEEKYDTLMHEFVHSTGRGETDADYAGDTFGQSQRAVPLPSAAERIKKSQEQEAEFERMLKEIKEKFPPIGGQVQKATREEDAFAGLPDKFAGLPDQEPAKPTLPGYPVKRPPTVPPNPSKFETPLTGTDKFLSGAQDVVKSQGFRDFLHGPKEVEFQGQKIKVAGNPGEESILPEWEHPKDEGWPGYLARGAYNQIIRPLGSPAGLIGAAQPGKFKAAPLPVKKPQLALPPARNMESASSGMVDVLYPEILTPPPTPDYYLGPSGLGNPAVPAKYAFPEQLAETGGVTAPPGPRTPPTSHVLDTTHEAEKARQAGLGYTAAEQYPGTRLTIPDRVSPTAPAQSGETALGFSPQSNADLPYPLNVVPNVVRPRTAQSQIIEMTPDRYKVSAPEPRPSTVDVTPNVEAHGPEPALLSEKVARPIPDTPPVTAPGDILPSAPPRKGIKAQRLEAAAKEAADNAARKIPGVITPEVADDAVKAATVRSPWRWFYDLLGTSGEKQLENMGAKEAAQLLQYTKTKGNQMGGQWANKINQVKKLLSPAEQELVYDILDGTAKLNPNQKRIADAVKTMRSVLDDIGGQAEQSGMNLRTGKGKLEPFKKMEGDYAPRIYPKEFFRDPERVRAELVKAGKSEKEIEKLMEHLVESKVGGKGKPYFGERLISPQHSRDFGLSGYHRNFEALEEHAYEMGKRIAEARHLGAKDIADKTSPLTKAMGGAVEPARGREIVENYLGRGARPDADAYKIAEKITKFEVASRLSMFVINNANNALTIPLRAGFKNTAKATVDLFKNYAGETANAMDDGALAILQREALTDIEKGGLITKAYGINSQETMIRTLAATSGRAAAKDSMRILLKNPKNDQAIKTMRVLFGKDADDIIKAGKLTDEQVSFAGGRMAEITQGAPDALTLSPALASTNPLVRLPLLFKRYAFTSTKNIYSALKDNPKLIPAATAMFAIGGEVTGDIKAVIKGAVSPKTTIGEELENRGDWVNTAGVADLGAINPIADRLVANLLQSWFFGIFGDIGEAIAGRRMQGMATGPAGSTYLQEVPEAIHGVATGDLKPVTKSVLRRVPWIGSGLADYVE